ncbi:hypothetical protein [Aeromicrobium sp.]|uniref:hypothetical protein n=1 Tax=Aeromicrobium sp. TaxID=1871063 RepID=UPI003C6044B6
MSGNDESTEESSDESLEVDVDKRVDAGYSSDDEISDDEAEKVEEERKERLDPDHRPENALVDNTQREFDPDEGFKVPGEEVDNGPEIGADRPEGATTDDE